MVYETYSWWFREWFTIHYCFNRINYDGWSTRIYGLDFDYMLQLHAEIEEMFYSIFTSTNHLAVYISCHVTSEGSFYRLLTTWWFIPRIVSGL